MIIATNILIIVQLLATIVYFTIILCLDSSFFQIPFTYIFLVLFLIFIIINIISLIMIYKSKKQEEVCKGYMVVSFLELIFGGTIPGILMLVMKEDTFSKNNQTTNNNTRYCKFCGNEMTIYDNFCQKCGHRYNEPYINIDENKISINDDSLFNKAMTLAINFEKKRLKDYNLESYVNSIKKEETLYNNYKCNLLSVDNINDKIITTFINVKCYDSETLDNVFSLTEEEINLLKFHQNFKIYCIFDLNNCKKIRVITHENYNTYLK